MEKTVNIRNAKPGDEHRIAEIEVFAYRLNFYPIFRTDAYFFGKLNVPALIEYYSAKEMLSRCKVYDDGVVKGFVRLHGEEIEKLFVEPAFRNLGIGGSLLECAIRAGGKKLLVLEKNENAIRLYRRYGFEMTGERQRVDDTKEFLLVMRRV